MKVSSAKRTPEPVPARLAIGGPSASDAASENRRGTASMGLMDTLRGLFSSKPGAPAEGAGEPVEYKEYTIRPAPQSRAAAGIRPA